MTVLVGSIQDVSIYHDIFHSLYIHFGIWLSLRECQRCPSCTGVQQGRPSSPQGGLQGSHWKDQEPWQEMERQAWPMLMEHQREAIDRSLATVTNWRG